MHTEETYIPALRYHWLTPLYDPFFRWGMREEQFRSSLMQQARIEPGHRVLDLGSGTATLTIRLAQRHPDASITGLDIDPAVLAMGRAKAVRAGVRIRLVRGSAYRLPFQTGSFDRALSSLMLHHLVTEHKQRTLSEVFRVLAPGGEIHLVDFGVQHSAYGRTLAPVLRHFEEVADNLAGRLPALLRQAGFLEVTEAVRYTTIVGDLTLYQGRKLGEEGM